MRGGFSERDFVARNPEFLTLVSTIVNLIVRGEYEVVEAMTRGQRLSANDLEDAVRAYGRHLIPPPPGSWAKLHVVAVKRRIGRREAYVAVVPMWTEEEGESDVALELRVRRAAQGLWDAEVLDLHVL